MTAKECYEKIGEDYEEIFERFGSDSMIKKFAVGFLKDPSFDTLKQSLLDKDGEKAFRAAHTLKGVCLNLGFSGLFEVSSALTEQLRDLNVEGTDELLSKVENKYAELISVLNELAMEE